MIGVEVEHLAAEGAGLLGIREGIWLEPEVALG